MISNLVRRYYTFAVIVISLCPKALTPTFIAFVLAIRVLVKISRILNLYSHSSFASRIPTLSRPRVSRLRGKEIVHHGEATWELLEYAQ